MVGTSGNVLALNAAGNVLHLMTAVVATTAAISSQRDRRDRRVHHRTTTRA